ncbi:MAG: transglycosylase SLT domain-containing protein [Actinobacteria bacterium]|nr:transglycosylase SLT domain-containing protein [Actinomycetota bacterium]
MSGVSAIASIGAVQARIGQIEQRFGVRRTLPVDTSSTPAATATASSTGAAAASVSSAASTAASTAVAPNTAAGASVAAAAAAIAADPSASLTELLGTDPTTGTTTPGDATSGASFDQVFQAAVAELQAQWQQSGLTTAGTTAGSGAVPAVGATSTLAFATPAAAAPVASGAAVAVGVVGIEGAVAASTPHAAVFEAAGARYGIPAKVLAAIGYVESRFRPDAVSSAGAVGMMQFLPSTAASMGVDPYDPASAIDGTARYLRSALDRFGSLDEAIASYNVGPGAIARAGGVQPGSQAERYLTKVLDATGRI